MQKLLSPYLAIVIFLFTVSNTNAQTTSWKGTTSTAWATSTNWTNGVPSSTLDAVVGDANFTGAYQPSITAAAYTKSITVGGTKASTLTLTKKLTVSGNITITSNGTISSSNTITLTGNWSNAGTYTGSGTSSLITFAGTTQTLGGSTVTTFRKIKINAGSVVTLSSNVILSGTSSLLTVAGTLNPSESPTYTVTAVALTISNNGVLKINASTFAGNYNVSGTTTLANNSIIEYSSTTTNQTVSSSYTYSTLRISGAATTKSLTANLTALKSSNAAYGNIYVLSGTFDLSSYTAARGTSTTGGTFSVSNGATLKIGSTNTFPANYNTNTLSLTSTVDYNGTNQTIATKTYGNLSMSSSSGAVTKTMPGTAFTVAGDFTSSVGAGTSVAYTVAANITISGNINIGASTTFNGSSYTVAVAGNWINNGTFTGSTSTVTMTGAGTSISGTGTQSFYNLTVTASNITSSSDMTIAGNLATTGSGVFTHNTGLLLTMSGTTKTISGTGITLANMTVSGTVTTANDLTITGNTSVSGSFTCSAGNITMNGSSKTVSGVGTIGFYGLLIPGSITTSIGFSVGYALDVSGSFSASAGTATFTGTATLNGTANLYNVTMNCTSLLLSTNSVLGIANVFTITAGTLNVTSAIPNTVSFNGTGTQTIPSTTYNQLTLSNIGTKTAGGAITANGVFTINTSTTFSASSYTHILYNNLVNNGTFTAGTSNITFAGGTDAVITGITTFDTLTINKNSSVNGVTLNSNINAATVKMTTGWIKAGSNTLTITTTRTGNGIITGGIKRQHAFTTGVAYAFEGPDNTVTFSAISSVTSVTVAVTQGSISDFPFGSSVNRTYNITVPAGTYTATLRLHYEDDELNGNTESTMQLWHYNGTTWNAIGKTANSTSSNYVEQSGLTNITNKWGFSDNASVLAWNGSVSSSWTNSANWTAIQGTPGSIPTANDVVDLGTISFTNNPAISSSLTVKSIEFGSVAATALTIASGGTLTVNGNISGTWSSNKTHTIAVGAQSLTVNGNIVLSDGTTGHTIDLTASTGTITVGGSLTESGGANVTFSGAASLYIAKDFNYTNGTFTANSSTVYYNGTNSQSIGAVTYNNLTSTKTSGTATIGSATTISGNLTISSSELDINATTNIAGNLIISSGATMRGATSTINISGNLNNSGTFIPGNGTITFNGTNNQSISLATFNNLTINKSSGNTNFTGNISVYGDFSIIAGNIDMGSYTANRTSLGGTFSISAGAALTIGGASNFPSNYSTYSLSATSTVTYNGTAAQTVNGVTYGHLILSNGTTNAKTLAATITVNGDITINSGATLAASVYTISLGGNWSSSGTFTPGTGAVLLNGSGKTMTGATTFNKVTIYGSYAVAGSNITYNGLINITPGASYDAGSGTATVNGDLTNSGTLTSAGTTTFTGTTTQTIRLLNAISSTSTGIINFNGTVAPVLNSTSTPVYATLNINNTGSISPSVGWTVLVAFNIASGATFNGGVSTHTIGRSFTNNGTVTSSGTLLFTPTANVTVALGSNFSSTGTVNFGGSGQITITGSPSALNDVMVTNTNSAGISPASGWPINGNFTIGSNSTFNAGSYSYASGGDIESDGTLNGGTSTFTMSSGSGELSGSPTTTFNNLIIAGTVFASDDYNVSGNFTNNGTYDAANSDGTLIMTGSGASTIGGTTNPNTIGELSINKSVGATATLSKNISSITNIDILSGTLDISSYTLTQDVAGGFLVMEDNGTLKIGSTNTLPTFTTYDLDTLSTIDYAGTTQSISNTISYGNLTVSASGTKTPAGALTVLNSFSLNNGTFVGGSLTHAIGGNWNMSSGAFTNTGTTILLNGTGTQDINSTGVLKNLTINKSTGSTTVSSDVSVDGVLTLTSGNVSTSSNKLIITSNGSVSRTSGHIIGNLQKNVATGTNVARTFEVGDATGYAPVSVSFASVSVAGNLIVKNTAADHTDIANSGINSAKSVNKYWTLTNSGITFTNYSSTFNFLSGDIDAGANTAIFVVANKNAGIWSYPTVGTKTSTSTQITGCTIFGDFQIGQNGAKNWTGATNNNWNDATNWSPSGVPAGGDNVTISTGSAITVNTAGVCNDIVCNSTGLVISIASSNSLTINGACTLTHGKIDINGQSLTLNGSFSGDATNCIKGSIASNLIIGTTYANNTGTNLFIDQTASTFNNYLKNFAVNSNVTLANAINIAAGTSYGTLTIGSGATLTTGGFLTLKSDANGTARVAAIPANGSGVATGYVSGNVTIERYIPARRSWRLMTTPLSNSNSIYESWQNNGVYEAGKGTTVTGPNAGAVTGIDASSQNTVTMKAFNPATQGFRTVTNTKTEKLANNTGNADNNSYYMFIRGDRNPNNLSTTSCNTTTLSSTGALQTGVQTFAASSNYNTYTLIGNPYASPVNFNNVVRSHILKRFYAWDPSLNKVGGYVVMDDADGDGNFSKSVAASAQGKDIQSGQAVLVLTDTAGSASLTFYETSKSAVNNNLVFRPAGISQESLNVTLNLVEQDNSIVSADGALAEFKDTYSSAVNLQDAVKLSNTNETLGFMRETKNLAIERRGYIVQEDTLFLNLTKTSQRNYQFVFNANNIDHAMAGVLEDTYTAQTTPLNLNGNTVINFTIDANAGSQLASRFRIVFKPAIVLLPVRYSEVAAIKQSKNIELTWKVENELNVKRYEVERSTDGINFAKINIQLPMGSASGNIYNWIDANPLNGDNYYRVHNIDADGSGAYSTIVKVTASVIATNIAVFPNVISNGEINLQLNNVSKGKYAVKLINTLGQEVVNENVNVTDGSINKIIQLSKGASKGIYQLEVIHPDNKKTTLKVLNQ